MNDLDARAQDTIADFVAKLKDKSGALLPMLHAIQDAPGCVPPAAVPIIAQGLNLSCAEVHGVITFYPYFLETQPGRHTIHLCRAEACQSMNQRGLEAHAKRTPRGRLSRDDRERRVLDRARVLPRELRLFAGDDDRRRVVRPRDG